MDFTQENMKKFREEATAALTKVAESMGLAASIGRIFFTDDELSFQVTVKDTSVNSRREEWNRWIEEKRPCDGLLTKGDFDLRFKSGRKYYTIVGILPNSPKNCIELMDEEGESYKTSPENLVADLGRVDPDAERDLSLPALLAGVKGTKWGDEFVFQGEVYCVIDILPKSPTYPIVAKCKATGVRYKFGKEVLSNKEAG